MLGSQSVALSMLALAALLRDHIGATRCDFLWRAQSLREVSRSHPRRSEESRAANAPGTPASGAQHC